MGGMCYCEEPRSGDAAISIQQSCRPFRGVGRLRLSLRGIREPHPDKCCDSRLFYFLKNGAFVCRTERNSFMFFCKEMQNEKNPMDNGAVKCHGICHSSGLGRGYRFQELQTGGKFGEKRGCQGCLLSANTQCKGCR